AWPTLSWWRPAAIGSDRRGDRDRLEWYPTDATQSPHQRPCAGHRNPSRAGTVQRIPLRALAGAAPGVQRQSARAQAGDRLEVPPQGPGPNADGDADRGRDDDRRTDLRIRPGRQRSSAMIADRIDGRGSRDSRPTAMSGCGATRTDATTSEVMNNAA